MECSYFFYKPNNTGGYTDQTIDQNFMLYFEHLKPVAVWKKCLLRLSTPYLTKT